VTAAPRTRAPQHPIGRIPVLDVRPAVDDGARPAKSVVDEEFDVTATVFREGHDAVNASVVLTDPTGVEHVRPMTCTNPGLNTWAARVSATSTGWWSYRVEGWSDPYGTWEHDATIKVQADVDTELMLQEGALVLERARDEVKRTAAQKAVLSDAVLGLRDTTRPAAVRLKAGTDPSVEAELAARPLRDYVTPSAELPLLVERELALSGAWYELFPRSEGATYDEKEHRWTTGTLRTAAKRLPAIAAMGFDVVYLTPVHPIGQAAKKGPNNTLDARPEDPGSPYAIGSPDGGHDAIHPDLGTFDDFDAFVAESRRLGMEVAMDLALQCSPDHPWVKTHPEWFTTRADGTIAYAENPPKKYQDIYPLNFDNDPAGIYAEVRRVVQVWIDHGVTLFRVDNPHTKPVEFWEWLIGIVNDRHPDVMFLAEAFTRPAMMRTLGKVGFQQSYTYFTWRTSKAEITEYIDELQGESAAYMRPNFWPNTPDILHEFLQYGGPAAFKLRAVLASTLSPCWGMYSGYELCEHVAVRHGSEEYLDSEKYQYRPRDWASYEHGGANEGRSIAGYLTRLNQARRDHPALQQLRGTTFHEAYDDHTLVYSRRLTADVSPNGREDCLVVVVNLDPHGARETTVKIDMPALGMDYGDTFTVHDLMTGDTFRWGEYNYVRLDPHIQPAHVFHLRRI
jgi:starch synthase (maltosyl-transferring)